MEANSNTKKYNLRKTGRSRALKEFLTLSKTYLTDLINSAGQNEQSTKYNLKQSTK